MFCCNLESFLHFAVFAVPYSTHFSQSKILANFTNWTAIVYNFLRIFASPKRPVARMAWHSWQYFQEIFSFSLFAKVCSTKLSRYTACRCLHHANTALASYCEQSLTARYYYIIITITFITVQSLTITCSRTLLYITITNHWFIKIIP